MNQGRADFDYLENEPLGEVPPIEALRGAIGKARPDASPALVEDLDAGSIVPGPEGAR